MDDEVLFSLLLPLVVHMSHTLQEMCAIMNEDCQKPFAIMNLIRKGNHEHIHRVCVALVMMKALVIAIKRHPVISD